MSTETGHTVVAGSLGDQGGAVARALHAEGIAAFMRRVQPRLLTFRVWLAGGHLDVAKVESRPDPILPWSR